MRVGVLKIGKVGGVEDDPFADSALLNAMGCCGLVELDGVQSCSFEDLQSTLRVAGGDKYGMVVATTTTPKGVKMVKRLGFRRATRFLNPNSGNTVTVWLGRLPR